MLSAPLATTTGWTWNNDAPDSLPAKLAGAFASTTRGTVGSTSPVVAPEAVSGNSDTAAVLRFPFTGYIQHAAMGAVHWIWGTSADPARFPTLLPLLANGNPIIAMRFTHTDTPVDTAFPKEGVRLGGDVTLDGTTGISVKDLTIVAAYPGDPGMDTLAVLRDLREKMNSAASAGGDIAVLASSWEGFVNALDSLEAPLRLLEPSGRPITGREFTVERPSPADDITATLDSSHRGNVLSAAGLTRGDLGAGTRLRIADPTVEMTTIKPGVAATDGAVEIDDTTSHVDVAVLDGWFGPQGSSALEHFNRGCRVTPLINGPEYFDQLFTELHATTLPAPAGTPEPLFYLSGYSMDHEVKLASANTGLSNRTLQEVAEMIADGGGEARFLALQMLQLDPSFTGDVQKGALLVALILASVGATAIRYHDSGSLDQVSFFGHSQALAIGLFFGAASLNDILDKLELNQSAIDELSAHASIEAFLDPYTAECPDNPLCVGSAEIVSAVHEAQRRFNVFHQKIAVVRNDAGLHAYCGGIDLYPNRLDDRDHGVRSPYHDVHARIDGPAAGELAVTFSERWERTGGTTLAVDAAGAIDSLPSDGPDIVQVARTYFGPDPSDASRALSFASSGERTILDTTIQAIRQARRYIYIEDQYLTPPAEYANALISAAAEVSGPLIIVIPETPDQPFGFEPRQRFVMDLAAAWGDRLKVGTMRGRFYRAQTNRKNAVGRLWLTEDLEEADNTIKVGPPNRVPGFPFWLVVGNEAIRVIGSAAGTRTTAQIELRVDREMTTNLFGADKGTKRAKHKAGAAACAGIFSGIYVHSKIMLIDDAFASIGSANCNRRGYYSDGECNIFALREELTHGDNWIRTMRTRLWSELAGVSEEYGATAFADPSRNMRLFDRKFLTGNRFSPFDAQPYSTALEIQTDFTASTSTLGGVMFILQMAGGLGQILAGTESKRLFDTFIDPSSQLDPSSQIDS